MKKSPKKKVVEKSIKTIDGIVRELGLEEYKEMYDICMAISGMNESDLTTPSV